MDFNKKLFLFFVIIISLNLVNAASQSVNILYSSYNNSYYESVLSFTSILLKINTENISVCKYSIFSGISYEQMEGNFDPGLGKVHERIFSDLEDGGIYKYYIKCKNKENISNNNFDAPQLEAVFKINSFVTADLDLSEKAPLKAGKLEVKLTTSKPVSQKPSLSYSFDGVVYDKVFLTGSEDNWKGFIIIPENSKDSILSFKFSGIDLDGRVGDIIDSGESFLIDTSRPNVISDLNAVGFEGNIRLDWYSEGEEIEEFKIYRSDSPDVSYTDFYTTTDESPFYDYNVQRGKTYYYKISPKDNAGNDGKLSVEVSATALINNIISSSSGLSVQFFGLVDNFLSEIDSDLEEISFIESSISGEKKTFFSDLKLDSEITNQKQELNILKKEAEKFKQQDLTKEELNKKLDSLRLKINIIRKKVPEDIVIIKEDSDISILEESIIEKAILELEPAISEKNKDKSVKESMRIIKESKLEINNKYYVARIVYLDGSKKEFSVIKRIINAELERMNSSFFVEIIPKIVVESISELDIKNVNYDIVKEDPVLSFSTDNKQLIYSFEKDSEIRDLKETQLSFVYLYNEEDSPNSKITSYFLFDVEKKNYSGIIIGFLVVSFLFGYFVYLKNKGSERSLIMLDKIKIGLDSLKNKDLKKSQEVYSLIVKDYKTLDPKDKKRVYKKIEIFHNSILLYEFKEKLEELKINRNKDLLEKLEKIYNNLSDDFKNKISSSFEKIKEDIKNES